MKTNPWLKQAIAMRKFRELKGYAPKIGDRLTPPAGSAALADTPCAETYIDRGATREASRIYGVDEISRADYADDVLWRLRKRSEDNRARQELGAQLGLDAEHQNSRQLANAARVPCFDYAWSGWVDSAPGRLQAVGDAIRAGVMDPARDQAAIISILAAGDLREPARCTWETDGLAAAAVAANPKRWLFREGDVVRHIHGDTITVRASDAKTLNDCHDIRYHYKLEYPAGWYVYTSVSGVETWANDNGCFVYVRPNGFVSSTENSVRSHDTREAAFAACDPERALQ